MGPAVGLYLGSGRRLAASSPLGAFLAAFPSAYAWIPDGNLFQNRDGSQATPAAADADPVGDWNEYEGDATNLLAASDAVRPTRQTVSSATCVRSDGTDDLLTCGSFSVNNAYTLVFRVALRTAGSFPTLFRYGSSTRRVVIRCNGTSRQPQVAIDAHGALTASVNPLTLNQKYTMTVVQRGASFWAIRLNGTQVATTNSSPAAPAAGTFQLFGSNDGASGFGQWDVFAFLVVNQELTGTDLTDAESLMGGY